MIKDGDSKVDTVDLIEDSNVLWILLENATKNRDIFLCWKLIRRLKTLDTRKTKEILE